MTFRTLSKTALDYLIFISLLALVLFALTPLQDVARAQGPRHHL